MNQTSYFRIPKLFLGGIISLYSARGIFWIAPEYYTLRDDEGMALIILGHNFKPTTILLAYAAGLTFGIYMLISNIRSKPRKLNEN